MDINLLLLDLDDTLLNSKGEMSKRTQEAVLHAVNKGITVAIASGRMHASLLPYVERLNTHGPVVSYNGALIKDSNSGKTLSLNPIPLELAKKILDISKEKGVHCQYYTQEDYFFEKHCDITEKYFNSTGIKGVAVGENLSEKIKLAPPKMLMIEPDSAKMLSMFDYLENEFNDVLHITRSKGHYIEIMNKGVNKGGALIKMCEIYNTKQENCMAIGDGLNDMEMIINAGIGVAVSTAAKELKEAADIVCESADEDGPAKIIEEYILVS
jgi:Cof subfamily protein (haloacid dehalogenase superfamily)